MLCLYVDRCGFLCESQKIPMKFFSKESLNTSSLREVTSTADKNYPNITIEMSTNNFVRNYSQSISSRYSFTETSLAQVQLCKGEIIRE